VGVPRSAIVGGLLLEAAIFTLAGAAIGSTIGGFVLHSWNITLNDLLWTTARTMGVALAIALLSSLYPVVRAARVNPLEALRYE
jgi:ABC-type antimicrobial peptide transport system permease subunit